MDFFTHPSALFLIEVSCAFIELPIALRRRPA